MEGWVGLGWGLSGAQRAADPARDHDDQLTALCHCAPCPKDTLLVNSYCALLVNRCCAML